MGISVDYGPTSGQFDSPLQCVCEARRHVLSSSQHQQARKVSQVAVPSTQPISWSSTTDQCVADCSYDSFDDCIQAADHMDAVLAYYYADEKEAGAVKVVEIFPLHRHPPVSDVTHATVSDVTPPTVADVTPPTVSDHLNASVPDLKDCSLPSWNCACDTWLFWHPEWRRLYFGVKNIWISTYFKSQVKNASGICLSALLSWSYVRYLFKCTAVLKLQVWNLGMFW